MLKTFEIMIVKVQQSLFTNEEEPQMLIYNKSKSVFYQAPLIPEVKELLGDRPKAYFKAKLVDSLIELHEEIKPQKW